MNYIDVRQLPDWFWDVIDRAKGSGDLLAPILQAMTSEQLRQFHSYYEVAREYLTSEPYTNYLFHINGKLSQDSRDDQAGVVVSKGKILYLQVLDHPEVLSTIDTLSYDGEDFYGAASWVYEERHGISLWDEMLSNTNI